MLMRLSHYQLNVNAPVPLYVRYGDVSRFHAGQCVGENLSFSTLRTKFSVAPFTLAVATFGVFFGVLACVELADRTNGITSIWLSNAILLAILLNASSRSWPALVIAGYCANVAAYLVLGDTYMHAIVLSFANSSEVLLVAVPLRKLALDRRLTRPISVALLCALTCGPAVGFSALIGAGFVTYAYGGNFYDTYFTWYLADVLSLITATPVLAAFRFRELVNAVRGKKFVVNLGLLVLCFMAIVHIFFFAQFPLLFLVFPPTLILTFRFGFPGGALALLMAAICSISATALGYSPFMLVGETFHEQLLLVQCYLAIVNFTILQTAASLAVRRKVELELMRLGAAHKRAKEKAEIARILAEEANRAKSTFLASMSHELRTPLNAIIGFSEIMKTETFGPMGKPIYTEYAADIHMSGQHLLSLVNDVLELSRIVSGKVELENSTFDLLEVLHEGIAILSPQASSFGVNLIYDLGEEPLMLLADRRRVLQIFINLLSNAVKFTPAGGKVQIWTERDQTGTRFAVADEGIGIAEADLPKVLSYFGQADGWTTRRNQGHGLGLPISKQLAELHGGNLLITSAVQRGTTVTIQLPASCSLASEVGNRARRPRAAVA